MRVCSVEGCGTKLSRFNDGDKCAPCSRAEREEAVEVSKAVKRVRRRLRCAIPYCHAPKYSRGLCIGHYREHRSTFCEVCPRLGEIPCPACGRAA